MDNIFITHHGYSRLRERNGWNAKTSNRMITRIFLEGKRPEQISGYVGLWARQLSKLKENESKTIIVYGQQLYVFADSVLVTTYHVPTKMQALRYINY